MWFYDNEITVKEDKSLQGCLPLKKNHIISSEKTEIEMNWLSLFEWHKLAGLSIGNSLSKSNSHDDKCSIWQVWQKI